ncbi:uncharacterized protein UDID_07164 [Ustilago sp. UG-2017a]|nr:uncharacterized protein UDID_07164 [Ustilago sp. UG-2017a]
MAGDEARSSRHDDRGRKHGCSHREHQESSRSSRSHRDRGKDRDQGDFHRRSRSPSPRPRRSDRSPSEGPHPILARLGVDKLTPDDYFIRSAEFKAWLSESKHKYLDEISSKEARRYFDHFVHRWNEGKLPDLYYKGEVRSSAAAAGASSQTRHKWTFSNKSTYSSKEQEQLEMIRDNVDTLTNGSSKGAIEARDAERKACHAKSNEAPDAEEEPRRDSGWNSRSAASSSKSYAESQLDREHREDLSRITQSESRRSARQDERDEEEAFHGRATGRDRVLEKKRERNAVNREFASRRQADDGIEMDDRDLYEQETPSLSSASRAGGQRGERATSKKEQARQERMEQRKAEMQEKVSALKEKDAKTMEMLKAMAQERFGSGGRL